MLKHVNLLMQEIIIMLLGCIKTLLLPTVFISINAPLSSKRLSHFLWEKGGQMPPKMALGHWMFCMFAQILSLFRTCELQHPRGTY